MMRKTETIGTKSLAASPAEELYEAFLLLENPEEVGRFMRDLCTPQEIVDMAERWRVCRLLEKGELSYREIHQVTGASLATITRVARFLKKEPHHGYSAVIHKIKHRSVE
ncbi:trp operon repressor [Candidatus Babeliales bacterium]|nr:trp operon repressor [Candidatus Babeliales bacterium]